MEILAAFFRMVSHKISDKYSFKTRKYITIMVDDFNTVQLVTVIVASLHLNSIRINVGLQAQYLANFSYMYKFSP